MKLKSGPATNFTKLLRANSTRSNFNGEKIVLKRMNASILCMTFDNLLINPSMHSGSTRWNKSLQWHHNDCDGVSNHQRLDYLLNRLFRHRSKKTSKLRITGICEGTPPVIGGYPSQTNSNTENVSIWWRHYGRRLLTPNTAGVWQQLIYHLACFRLNSNRHRQFVHRLLIMHMKITFVNI